MRVSRQWRDLILRKEFGKAHDPKESCSQGGLAFFCPACPQPGINTPVNWQDQPRYQTIFAMLLSILFMNPWCSWLYRRSIVVDGNFSLEHMKMKKSEDDVFLSDGEGYMVSWTPYQEHLEGSSETTQVVYTSIHPSSDCLLIQQRATCANHKAVNQANSNRKNLEATGVGACACARHGCFVPHSVVDFQKGER